MTGAKGRSGGARPGSGRKPKPRVVLLDPLLQEALRTIQRDIEAKLAASERREYGPLLLKRLTAIERLLGMNELHRPARHSRRHPLGRE
jgi:hypothetical protein